MKFNLTHYKKYKSYVNKNKIVERNFTDLNNPIKPIKPIKNIEVNDTINILNNKLNKTTPEINNNINIIFDNFSIITSIKDWIDIKLKNKDISHSFGYDPNTKNINIRKNFINNSLFYHDLINIGISEEEIMNFAILHEIGHCLHNLSLDKNKIINYDSKESNFINTIMPNFDKTWIVKNHEIMERLNNSIVEGFADLYSLILLDKIYPDNQALKIIEAVKNVREEKQLHCNDTYHTYTSIEKYIKQRNEMKANLNDFHSINQYICQNTLQEAFSIIEQYTTPSFIESDSKHKKDVFLLSGVLYEAYNLKKENVLPDAESVLKYIKENNFLNHNIENNIEKIFDFNSLYPTYNSSFEIGRSEYLSTKNDGVLKNKIKNIKKMLNRDNDFNIHINKNNKSKYN